VDWVLECWPWSVVLVLLLAGEERVLALAADVLPGGEVVPVHLLSGPGAEGHGVALAECANNFHATKILDRSGCYTRYCVIQGLRVIRGRGMIQGLGMIRGRGMIQGLGVTQGLGVSQLDTRNQLL